ncbi:hypothetical protein QTP70_018044 [Hemibagrus guttatus]|uniref:Uncharacterized protein n=1 Tax=Hemibagrus guttatus TaxID=175788 RepID=A0AAE0PQD9_9TELE|nr:hypothetical protein QTP70_018044 [Hemibagrus guttatus]
MKNAQKTAEQIEKICKDIERLQEKLSEECKSQDLSSNEVQCKITARILRAMAKRSGRDLPLSRLIRLLTTIDTHSCLQIVLSAHFFTTVGTLLGVLGVSSAKIVAKKGAKYASNAMKTVLKGTGQVAGGALVLAFTLPELIDNCEKLVKNKHETEASRYLRTKAGEMRDAVKKVKNLLTELQEMLSEIPETECHVDLATEMCGSQTYTRGTICMEYKQTKKQDRKIEKFILISTKDISSKIGSKCKHMSDDKSDKNKKQKSLEYPRLVQQWTWDYKNKKPEIFSKIVKEFQFRLPTITMSNLRSLPNKIEEIKEMMGDDELFASDLMFFTETWLNRNSPPISLDG